MASDVLAVADRLWNGEISTATFHPVDHVGGFVEITDGVGFCPSFANVSAFATDDGLAARRHRQRAAGPGRPRRHPHLEPGPPPHRRLLPRAHRPRLRRPGLGGGGRGAGLGGPRGRRPPRPAGPLRPLHLHRRLQHRSSTVASSASPTCSGPPSTATRTGPTTTPWTCPSAGVAFALRHEKGETDDHTVTWQPDRRVLCCGDLFIWASPNAGNPQKVQRYPREWAAALRRMLDARRRVPAPGPRVPRDRGRPGPPGPDRHGGPARLPGRPDAGRHERRRTARRRHPRRPRRRPSSRRGPTSGPSTTSPSSSCTRSGASTAAGGTATRPRSNRHPSGPWPPSWPRWPAAPGPWPTEPSSCWPRRGTRPELRPSRPTGRCALAGHLAEYAWLAAPDDAATQRARQQVFAARAARATSTMARGVFTWAANESAPPPHPDPH